MKGPKTIDILTNFRWADKYATFHKMMPGIGHIGDEHKEIISGILDQCCIQLLKAFENKKKPLKAELRDIITQHMNLIFLAPTTEANRDFGYELCWYLSDKIGLNFKLRSDSKVWGYWKVDAGSVKGISRIRQTRKSKK